MGKQIEPKLKKIGDYLNIGEKAIFIIPEYQRPYSWKIEQCDKLWQDIIDFIESGSKDSYFFGTIIVNCQENDTKLALIDGQQRTITFLLLLKALLIRINKAILSTERDEESEKLCRGLKERRRRIIEILYKEEAENISERPNTEDDRKIYKKINILKNNSINEYYKDELKIILESETYNEAEENSTKIPYKQKDNRYTSFFRNFKYFYNKIIELSDSDLNRISKSIIKECEVIEIRSWEVEQAITMFNSLNADGLPLCDSDIISAQLYSSAKKQNKDEEYNKVWNELKNEIHNLEYKKLLNIDSLLMQQMYYERAKNRETVTESGSVDVTTPGLRRYFTEINRSLINNPLESCRSLLSLAKMWNKIFEYPIVQVLFKFNENFKLFLASYLLRFNESQLSENKIDTIVNCLIRLFTIMELVDTGYSSRKFKTFLFKEQLKFVDISINESEIEKDFKNHIRTEWNEEELKNEIMDYEKNVLIYLNEYLYAKNNYLNFSLNSQYDIEHIMPNSGNNLKVIRDDAQITDQNEFIKYVNKLGNKILLEYKINRSIGNEWFRTKISTNIEKKTGYKDSSYPLAHSLVKKYCDNNEKKYWTKDDIDIATNEATSRIIEYIFQ